MKISPPLLLALAVIFLASCNAAQFTEPMPAGKKDLSKFPKAYQGDWSDGETTLWVGETQFYHSEGSDTLAIGPQFHLRKISGMLVISFPENIGQPDKWTVMLAEICHTNLTLRQFDPEDKAASAIWREVLGREGMAHVKQKREGRERGERGADGKKSHKPKKSERKRIVLSPTKAQFKTLIKRGASTWVGELRPVSSPADSTGSTTPSNRKRSSNSPDAGKRRDSRPSDSGS
jgi:hypothetical protein